MQFITDQQTLDDLNVFGKAGNSSVYEMFNHTSTLGGAGILEGMFRCPLSAADGIQRRLDIIQFFAAIDLRFPFQNENFAETEDYLNNRDERSRIAREDDNLARKFNAMIVEDPNYRMISIGVKSIISMVDAMRRFVVLLQGLNYNAFSDHYQDIVALLDSEAFVRLPHTEKYRLSYEQLSELDVVLRFRNQQQVRKLLDHIYHIDVFITVAKVAVRRGFVFPVVSVGDQPSLLLEGVYHPHVKTPVCNSIAIDKNGNVIFLTGANMAGKSTFMKSLGVAVYLAHMGFPVAASKMEFSVFDGMLTTINLSDNLNAGASHFYAEVLRVKKIARTLQQSRKLFVMIDELFRGTNVKDACEATIAITGAFAAKHDSVFVISTHIIEAGAVLKAKYRNIRFCYLPTSMNGNKPVYTYQLKNGITDDRHGMVIIRNEGILEILERGKL
ncbi:DNA mismatch repair protein [Pedobacter sp. KBW06]|uniref:MutS-related protein n=1 Tax=Pedobacter sp. KBW06 TaxID=2153359 RepID=UPI000F593A42|nr:DNA mismatch repair protein [Pedobacter sp. KBW06]RQO74460.1 DNA mismatch repair protein [Pedobacter sp. KBW06]